MKLLHKFSYAALGLIAAASLAAAQDQPRPWRSVDDPPPDQSQPAAVQPDQNAAPDFAGGPNQQNPTAPDPQNAPVPNQNTAGQNGPPPPDNYGVPPHLTIKPGTFVTVRINQWLSSDRNQTGDAFTATLAQPIVVDGVIVAQRGQTIGGRVTEAQKAGRVEGTSRLGVQLTDLTLADGQTVPIQSQMINRNGPTSTGRDAAAVGGTTALGAAIGAGVGWGTGAAIGAGAGAAAGIIGVLLTRGRPTVIYPESVLTFRIEAPVDFSTERAPQAFQFVNTQGYQQQGYGQGPPPRIAAGPGQAPYPYAGYGYAPGYPAPYPYYGYGYPYYGYPGFSVFVGPGFYGPRFYGGFRGFRR